MTHPEVSSPVKDMAYAVRLAALLFLVSGGMARAQLGAPEKEVSRLLGNPVKSSAGFRHYKKPPHAFVIHYFQGVCDQICVSSEREISGLPEPLSDGDMEGLLRDFGGGTTWTPVARLSMNRVWNSSDGKSFAIYETIYNKLVLMTRDAYRREKKPRP